MDPEKWWPKPQQKHSDFGDVEPDPLLESTGGVDRGTEPQQLLGVRDGSARTYLVELVGFGECLADMQV